MKRGEERILAVSAVSREHLKARSKESMRVSWEDSATVLGLDNILRLVTTRIRYCIRAGGGRRVEGKAKYMLNKVHSVSDQHLMVEGSYVPMATTDCEEVVLNMAQNALIIISRLYFFKK